LAAYFLSNGLQLARATRMAGPHFRANFFFHDPHDTARALTKQYLTDTAAQRLISSRRVMSEVLGVLGRRDVCGPDDVADEIARVDVPFAER
jgi:hypothetical protein